MKLCDFGCGNNAIITFKNGKNCCSKTTSSCPAVKSKNNPERRINLDKLADWAKIQESYDNNLSQRDLCKQYKLSPAMIQKAVKSGLLTMRNKSDAMKVCAVKYPRSQTNEFKEQQRTRMIQRYEAGWDNKAGRCKKYKYTSYIAGNVTLDGTWELGVAKWLDSKSYNWRRNTKRFRYVNLKNKISHYTPDFWVEELGGYLEVKGYETKLDRCKWQQFTENLIVWKKKDLQNLNLL